MNMIIKLISRLSSQSKFRPLLSSRLIHNYSMPNELISNENYDTEYYLNPDNFDEIIRNIKMRKIESLSDLLDCQNNREKLAQKIKDSLHKIPNKLDPIWFERKNQIYPIETIGEAPKFDFELKTAESLLKNLGLLYLSDKHLGNLGVVGGKRSYSLVGDLMKLEHAVFKWTLDKLVNEHQFIPVVAPQIVYSDIIEACGFNPFGERSQVYSLAGDKRASLIGTSEIPLAALHIGETFDEEDLPKKYCCLSRCYRAEAKTNKENAGLYRVHYFNKIEMFAFTTKEQSQSTFEDFVEIQKNLFNELQLHFKVLDMPPLELGLPAARKIDCECWLPGRNSWGEMSSSSNCLDYQSRRLNIKYKTLSLNEETNEIFKHDFVHTVNGTGCASPRILIAICENYQTKDGFVKIPQFLREFMNGQEFLKQKC